MKLEQNKMIINEEVTGFLWASTIFDDGREERYRDEVLRIMKNKNVKFFEQIYQDKQKQGKKRCLIKQLSVLI